MDCSGTVSLRTDSGKNGSLDMLAVSHNSKGSRRHATPESPLRGVSLFVDVPVRTLVFDAVVQRDLFPGVMPQFFAYNPWRTWPCKPQRPFS